MPTDSNYKPEQEILEILKNAKETILTDRGVIHVIERPRAAAVCPHCGCMHCNVKDYRWQDLILGMGPLGKPEIIRLRKRRYICTSCRHTFCEILPGFKRYQRRSQASKRQIVMEAGSAVPFSLIAKRHATSATTVMRYFDGISYGKPLWLPSAISIDEFKGNAQGQKYQVAIVDADTHKIVDILPRRDVREIIRYFESFSMKEREKVKCVIMDLSPIFRKAVKCVFPNAAIIGDRFHIQRLVTWALERVRKRAQKEAGNKRLYFCSRRILTKPANKLNRGQAERLACVLEKCVDMRKAYALKEAFRRLWEMKDEDAARATLDSWLGLVREAGLEEFSSLLLSFAYWRKEIIAAALYRYSNGVIEGKNNKIKVLKRVSYGVRNFNRFRNRILFMEACR